jgi:hypothetical protein
VELFTLMVCTHDQVMCRSCCYQITLPEECWWALWLQIVRGTLNGLGLC